MTVSGLWVDAAAPDPKTISIHDIANGLALSNRFAGQTPVPYSVAQHSVLCARVAPDELRLEALMHDAAEAYLPDIPRPIKYMPELAGYRKVEARIMTAIRTRFELRAEEPTEIKLLDRRMCKTEAYQLGFSWWDEIRGAKMFAGVECETWTWKKAKREFLRMFTELTQ